MDGWVTYNCNDHSRCIFAAGGPGSSQENDDSDGDGDDGEDILDGFHVSDNDHELDGEAEEEEKVEFQKRDIDL